MSNEFEKTKKDKIHTIKSIRNASEIEDVVKVGTVASSFVAGYFGLANLATIIEQGSLNNNATLMGFTAVTGGIFTLWLAAYLKEKISSVSEIKQIRKNTGMTKEEQRKVLESLVLEGDAEAIQLYDYFYGEKKRKRL